MPHLNLHTYLYKNNQTASDTCLVSLNKMAVKTGKLSRLFTLLSTLVLSSTFLSGCGQKGELYLTKDAPSNTDFILYDGNKVEGSDKAAQAANQQKIEEVAAEEPQDY